MTEKLPQRCSKQVLFRNFVLKYKWSFFTSWIPGFPEHIKIVPFYDVVYNGTKLSKSAEVAPLPNAPKKDDVAIIMFTSGSTGVRFIKVVLACKLKSISPFLKDLSTTSMSPPEKWLRKTALGLVHTREKKSEYF